MSAGFISVTEAIDIAKNIGIPLSRPTVHAWAGKHGLGHQLNGQGTKWVINRQKWLKYLSGGNT